MKPFPTPALDAWRAELAAGRRTRTDYDVLWRAASCEQQALEAHADGLTEAADRDRRRAAKLLRSAAA